MLLFLFQVRTISSRDNKKSLIIFRKFSNFLHPLPFARSNQQKRNDENLKKNVK